MITAGIDLASQSTRTAVCVIDWSSDRANVTELTVGVDDLAIVEIIANVDKVGIDVPLGWPSAFADAVAQHTLDGSWPADYVHSDSRAFRLRRTDHWVWEMLGMPQPLSVSADRIAMPAMRAAAVLSRLPERVALDGSGVVLEAYPAAALRRWDLPSRGYKGDEHSGIRHDLVMHLKALTAKWLDADNTTISLCKKSDDAFDALIAALVARAASVDQVEPIPAEHRAAATREGWIAVPRVGSLAHLPRAADPA